MSLWAIGTDIMLMMAVGIDMSTDNSGALLADIIMSMDVHDL